MSLSRLARRTGTRSLAAVLTADRTGFAVLTAAVLAVLNAKPGSPVGVLADGSAPLTAFIPDDTAFRRLAADLQGSRRLPDRKQAFTAIAGLGIDTVEGVLLHHVVPGSTITRAALRSDGPELTTAAGKKIKVDVYGHWWARSVKLVDAGRSDPNPRVLRFDVNRGNRQIAHPIDRVLRPGALT